MASRRSEMGDFFFPNGLVSAMLHCCMMHRIVPWALSGSRFSWTLFTVCVCEVVLGGAGGKAEGLEPLPVRAPLPGSHCVAEE